jgi:hypothetical protein
VTEEGPASDGRRADGPGIHEPPETHDERDRRLAALLSVDIGAAAEAHADAAAVTPGGAAGPAGAPAEAVPRPQPSADGGDQRTVKRPPGRNVVSFAVLALLLTGGVGLVYAGTRIIRSSTEGEVFTPEADPDAPGFEALVDPTPTLALLQDRGGLLESITVLTLPDPDSGGGGVLFVPDRTVADLQAFGDIPIEAGYDLVDAQFEAQAVGQLLGTAMHDHEVLDDERWSDLVEPVAPIVLDNPNELYIGGEVRFPIGEISLEADDVGDYLAAEDVDGSDLARLARHETFWEAWLSAVAADGSPTAVPGEIDSGIGRFVRGIAEGPSVIETLPVQPVPDDRYGEETAYFPAGEELTALVGRLVPFPVSASPGDRARLRLLNGTGDTSEAATVAADLPPAGVEVVLIGNATSLDHEKTRVRYVGDQYRDEALAVVDILGVGEVVEDPRPSDAADITVTLGADHV